MLDTAARHLPARWADALDRVPVEWRDDLPAQVHGRTIGGRILLKRELLDRWMQDGGADREAATARPALAAVIHELAHLYDDKQRLSRNPRLLDLAGWQVAALRPGRTRNAFTDRSPDAYELSDPAEFVAVNLEHFLLDPAYACRRPALQRYFATHFGSAPATAECAPALPFVQADANGDDPLLQLDPERVYAVDYLLAEGNDQPMSRWGHSMLRLVVCAPGRPRGPDCRYDLAHHRVVSFRAFVDDVQISSWRGLTGAYPSRLFLLPLDQVIEEYTRIELRGLQSIPLQLQQDEIATLLERAAQLHWSYDGRYYFVSNNCAVETYKLLHDGVPRLAQNRLSSITPTGLLRRLERADLADGSVLADRAEALRTGYYFEPLSARYQAMFEVAKTALALPQAHVQDWLDLPAQDRTPWIGRADLRSSAALLLLEQAALRRQELRARDELKRRLLGRVGGRDTAGANARTATQEILHLEDLLTRPAQLLPGGGYGLPQPDEYRAAAGESRALATQSREQREKLLAAARRWLPLASQRALEATEANIDLLGQRLRELHDEQNGFQLP
nr:DUF4105 domain-containing protein [Lysobacter terrestris]